MLDKLNRAKAGQSGSFLVPHYLAPRAWPFKAFDAAPGKRSAGAAADAVAGGGLSLLPDGNHGETLNLAPSQVVA